MIRFLGVCVVLAIGCIAAVVLGARYGGIEPNTKKDKPAPDGGEVKAAAEPGAPPVDKPVGVTILAKRERATQTLILPDGRVLPGDRVDLASDREGSLMFLATPARPGEFVPPEKLITREMTVLAVNVRPGEEPRKDELIFDPSAPTKRYRKPRATDTFEPGTTAILTIPMPFRKLAEDDEVEEGQIIGMIRPDLSVADLSSKQAKVRQAKEDYRATVAISVEMNRQLDVTKGLYGKGGATRDELFKAQVQLTKAKSDEYSKEAGIEVSQQEMSASWTTLKLHVIRAPLAGTIRTLYKQPGEAVKNLDNVVLLQNTRRLRVETQIEVQDALLLRERIDQARRLRNQANRLTAEVGGAQAEAEAKVLRTYADALVAVEIEASRPQPPVAVLRGHLQEVTCVAVSGGTTSRIVSGSIEGIVRVWEKVPGEERWEERAQLHHYAPISAIACTPAGSKKHLLMTATSVGRVRLFDLDNLKAGEKLLPDQHKGSVNAIAFTADGKTAATGGDDRSIMLWNVGSETLLLRKAGAHQAAITSLAYTPISKLFPEGQLVSAGRDKGLFVWSLGDGNGNEKVLTRDANIRGRSGDVTTLGLDPTGEYTLLDEGRELRVVALGNQHIEGALSNSGASGSFSTLALFSPDGKMILTNGAAAGRLQLWRAPSSKVRAAELRQLLWSSGNVTCGTFDPSGGYAVTGTSDHRVLVWKMPSVTEATRPIKGELAYVEGFLDTNNKRVTVRATMDNSLGLVIPGSAASIVVPPAPPAPPK